MTLQWVSCLRMQASLSKSEVLPMKEGAGYGTEGRPACPPNYLSGQVGRLLQTVIYLGKWRNR